MLMVPETKFFQYNDGTIINFDANDRVILKPYKPREPLKLEYMSDAFIQHNVGSHWLFDTECYPNYWLIMFMDFYTSKVLKLKISDKESFNRHFLHWIIQNHTLIGFNSISYDSPMMFLAGTEHGNRDTFLLKRLSDAIIKENMYIRDIQQQFNFTIPKFRHVDLIEVCPLNGSLKTYAARLHAKRLQDLPISDMKTLTLEEKDIVDDYCASDLFATKLITENLFEQLQLREDLTEKYKVDLMSKSDAQISEAVISTELKRLTGYWPKKVEISEGTRYQYQVPTFIKFKTPQMQAILDTVANAWYSVNANGKVAIPDEVASQKIKIGTSTYRMGNGGLHTSEKSTNHRSGNEYLLIDRDVASYYPMIVLILGLFPKHLGKMFLKVYKSIVDTRLEAKANKLSAIADALKIVINGAFGKLGSMWSILFSPDLLIQVTVTGQLALMMLIEDLELAGNQVVSANTDGFVTRVHRDAYDGFLGIIKAWEQATGFTTEETRYSAIYSRDVNAYLAIKEPDSEGKISTKGKNVFFDPWSGGKKEAIFRFHKNPSTTICIQAAIKFITESKPILETIKECKDIRMFVNVKKVNGGGHIKGEYLGKVVRWYYSINSKDNTINYVTNNNKVGDSDGALPCMDLPDEFPNDIDYDWYVRKTISLLEDLSFLSPAGQSSLFDLFEQEKTPV